MRAARWGEGGEGLSVGTKIEWAEATWNCLVGCTPVSAGCLNCYAAGDVWRHSHPCKTGPRAGQPNIPEFVGLTVKRNGRAVFNGQVRMLEDKLTVPLKRKKATRWFVNSLSDLFHESVPFEFVDRVMAVAALCPQHQFLVLSKRAERMEEYFAGMSDPERTLDLIDAMAEFVGKGAEFAGERRTAHLANRERLLPLPNVWLGVSCEDQVAADARIPHLLRCPAAVRFLSCEPLLGAIDLKPVLSVSAVQRSTMLGYTLASRIVNSMWVIVGGESGRGTRACNVEWVRSIVGQCRDAGVSCFVKQLGKRIEIRNDSFDEWPREGDGLATDDPDWRPNHQGEAVIVRAENSKGGNPDEWPEDLRVREMPGEGKGSGIGDQATGKTGGRG